jgi:hypothetical protein
MDFDRELAFRFPLARGEDVRAVQLALTVLQTSPPCGIADGIYGNATRLAVEAFQRGHGLSVDGVVGSKTWATLFKDADARQPTEPAVKSVSSALVDRHDLPLGQSQGLRVHAWLQSNFGSQIKASIDNTPIDAALISAIICKETAPVWLGWMSKMSAAQILERCVFDASGDAPRTSRGAFPRNTAAFRQRYGDALTNMLIAEANSTRRLRGYTDQQWVYKGYGIFQYDLQHIDGDRDFFENKQWRSMEACLNCFKSVMLDKLKQSAAKNHNVPDFREAARMYNGSGVNAENYADQVMAMYQWFLS